MRTIKVFISGTVQGVFFRKFIESKANELEIKGFVRNLDDGRVEAVFEGEDKKIKEMLENSKQGSKHTEIKNLETQELKHQGFDSFKILNI